MTPEEASFCFFDYVLRMPTRIIAGKPQPADMVYVQGSFITGIWWTGESNNFLKWVTEVTTLEYDEMIEHEADEDDGVAVKSTCLMILKNSLVPS